MPRDGRVLIPENGALAGVLVDKDDRIAVRTTPRDRRADIDTGLFERGTREAAVLIVTECPEVRGPQSQCGAGTERRRHLSAGAPIVTRDANLRGFAAARQPRHTVDVIDRVLAEADDVDRRHV